MVHSVWKHYTHLVTWRSVDLVQLLRVRSTRKTFHARDCRPYPCHGLSIEIFSDGLLVLLSLVFINSRHHDTLRQKCFRMQRNDEEPRCSDEEGHRRPYPSYTVTLQLFTNNNRRDRETNVRKNTCPACPPEISSRLPKHGTISGTYRTRLNDISLIPCKRLTTAMLKNQKARAQRKIATHNANGCNTSTAIGCAAKYP